MSRFEMNLVFSAQNHAILWAAVEPDCKKCTYLGQFWSKMIVLSPTAAQNEVHSVDWLNFGIQEKQSPNYVTKTKPLDLQDWLVTITKHDLVPWYECHIWTKLSQFREQILVLSSLLLLLSDH